MNVDPWLVACVALLVGQRAATHPAAVAALAVAALGLLARRAPRWALVVAALAAGLGATRATLTLRSADAAREQVRIALGPPSRCEARALVLGSPVKKGDSLRWSARLEGVSCEGRAVETPIVARLYGGPDDTARGDRLELVVQLAPAQIFKNLVTPDARPTTARSAVTASGSVVWAERIERGHSPGTWVDRARAHVRARIEATYAGDAAPMARALVLGEEDLAPEDGEAFRKSGLSHLLAVSGTHLVVVVAGVVSALRAALLRVRRLSASFDVGRIAAAFGVALAFIYADFAGASGSALRAAAMMGATLGAQALGRRGEPVRALGLSLLALGVVDPLAAYDLSLLLSAAATAGLIALGGPLTAWAEKTLPTRARWAAGSLGSTLAATMACAPLTAVISPTLPVAGIAANLLAVPVGEAAALPLCLAHALLGWLPWAERGAAAAASGALVVVRAVARAAASPGWAALRVPPPTEAQGVALALGVIGALTLRASMRKHLLALVLVACGLAELAARRAGCPRGVLRVTSLDVGQGDSTLVDMPDGRVMLVDGGGFVGSPVDPGRSVILPELRARRRGRIDVAVLSHPHPDHFTGLATALAEVDVGELWDTGQGEDEGAGPVYAAMLAALRARGVPILRPRDLCGLPRRFGEARVEVLAPCPDFARFGNANDNSLVLRISMGRKAALLVGDAEADEERDLLDREGARLAADLLKAGHHGSRTSTTPAFLAAVRPSWVVLSCGVRNRFGHPHPRTLATLSAAAVNVARTDLAGAFEWSTDGVRVDTRQAAPSVGFTSR